MGYQSYSSGAKIMYFVTNTNFESNKLKKYIRQTIYSSSFFNYKLILLPHISFKPASFSQCNISLHPQSETQGRFERNTRTFRAKHKDILSETQGRLSKIQEGLQLPFEFTRYRPLKHVRFKKINKWSCPIL